ncbi:MAG: TonB family protein [Alphaproteobacteria bacterium]|nr:TonB family protein [Alphaproteobacteria bacterium]
MSADGRLFPVALLTSAVLHVGIVLAVLPDAPLEPANISQQAIEVTLEPPARPTEGPAPAAPTGAAEQAARNLDPGSAEPEETAPQLGRPDAAAAPPPVPREPDIAQMLPATEPPPAVEALEFARNAPAAGPGPRLEDSLPALDAPPRVTGREFAMTAPPATPKAPIVEQRAQAPAPPQPVRQAKPRRAPQQEPADDSQSRAWHSASPANKAVNEFSDRRAQQDYLWQIVRKLSAGRFYQSAGQQSEQGVVVARITLARDGRLIDCGVARSSGFADLDHNVIETIRRASPFPPFPSDAAVDSATFIVPITYTQDR